MEACPYCGTEVQPQLGPQGLVCPACHNTGVPGAEPWRQQPPAAPASALGAWSLVLGVSSMFLGLLTGIPAVILGVKAFTKARRAGSQGQGMAVAGIVTGGIGTLVGTTVVLSAIVFMLVSGLSSVEEPVPDVSFAADRSTASLTVVRISGDFLYGDLGWEGDCDLTSVNGGPIPRPATALQPGDVLQTDCMPGEAFALLHTPTRTTVFRTTF